jgi:hypothetical protein
MFGVLCKFRKNLQKFGHFFLDTAANKRHLPAHLKRVPEPRGRQMESL